MLGSWEMKTLVCISRTCDTGFPSGPEITHTCEGARFGETCSASCASGFTLSGPVGAYTCAADGSLTADHVPVCLADCLAFPSPGVSYALTNKGGFQHGAETHVSCAWSYVPADGTRVYPAVSTCEDGTWTSWDLSCQEAAASLPPEGVRGTVDSEGITVSWQPPRDSHDCEV